MSQTLDQVGLCPICKSRKGIMGFNIMGPCDICVPVPKPVIVSKPVTSIKQNRYYWQEGPCSIDDAKFYSINVHSNPRDGIMDAITWALNNDKHVSHYAHINSTPNWFATSSTSWHLRSVWGFQPAFGNRLTLPEGNHIIDRGE